MCQALLTISVYMSAEMGYGPKDGLLIAIGKRLPKMPIGVVEILLFAGKALDICRQLILLCLKQPVPMIKGRSAPRPEFSHQRKVFCPKYSI